MIADSAPKALKKLLFFTFACLLLMCPPAYAQLDSLSTRVIALEKPSNLSITGFSYPTFLNGEMHAEFSVAYPIDTVLEAELKGFYDTYMLSNITRFAFLGNYGFGEQMNLFSGMAIDVEQNKATRSLIPPRFSILSGVDYDVNESLNMELRYEHQLNSSSGLSPYGYNLPSQVSARARYRF